MNDLTVRRMSALFGFVTALGVVITMPLYFMYGGAPEAWVVLTRDLVNIGTCVGLLGFFTGLHQLSRGGDPVTEWLSSLAMGAGLIFVAVALVSISLEAGVVFGARGALVDPTTDGPLAEANILIHGSIKRMLNVIYLTAAGMVVLRTRVLPHWLGWAAFAIALFNAAFVPSLYYGIDPSQFYSAHGWGNSAFAASFLMYWILAASLALLGRPKAARI